MLGHKYLNLGLKACVVGIVMMIFIGSAQTYIFGKGFKSDSSPLGGSLGDISQVEVKTTEIEPLNSEIEAIKIEESKSEICDLTFWSNKEGGYWEVPPQNFVDRIKDYDCNSQKWLSRLAHYESQYNPDAKNGAFEGLYQIGNGDTRDFCINNGRNSSDEDCALYLVGWLDEMPLMFESHFRNLNSFSDLFIF